MRPARFPPKRNTPENTSIRSETMKLDPQIIESAALLIIAAGVGIPVGRAFARRMIKRGWWE
jgi:hypothetical protein